MPFINGRHNTIWAEKNYTMLIKAEVSTNFWMKNSPGYPDYTFAEDIYLYVKDVKILPKHIVRIKNWIENKYGVPKTWGNSETERYSIDAFIYWHKNYKVRD